MGVMCVRPVCCTKIQFCLWSAPCVCVCVHSPLLVSSVLVAALPAVSCCVALRALVVAHPFSASFPGLCLPCVWTVAERLWECWLVKCCACRVAVKFDVGHALSIGLV
jgi:hypothetical protein